jgi:8-oxo-dGTP diphosphatase
MRTVRVVAGVIVQQGRVLVALRAPDMPLPGRWEFPGGKVEAGESDEAALERELSEELRVAVVVGRRLAESSTVQGNTHIHLVAYRCAIRAGEPTPVQHAELRWVSSGELDTLGWAAADVPLLDAVRGECT